LCEVARALVWRDFIRSRADRLPRPRQRLGYGKQAGCLPLDIGVDHHRAPPERDRRDRCGGVVAQPRQLAQFGLGVRKIAALGHRTRRFREIARARVIAQPRPSRHDVGLVGSCECFDRRPARGEGCEIRLHRRNRRLL